MMTSEHSPEEPLSVDATAAPIDDERRHSRLETRLAQAEAQIQTLQERMMEINAAQGSAKQRALWARVFILLALLGAFFFMRQLKGG